MEVKVGGQLPSYRSRRMCLREISERKILTEYSWHDAHEMIIESLLCLYSPINGHQTTYCELSLSIRCVASGEASGEERRIISSEHESSLNCLIWLLTISPCCVFSNAFYFLMWIAVFYFAKKIDILWKKVKKKSSTRCIPYCVQLRDSNPNSPVSIFPFIINS